MTEITFFFVSVCFFFAAAMSATIPCNAKGAKLLSLGATGHPPKFIQKSK